MDTQKELLEQQLEVVESLKEYMPNLVNGIETIVEHYQAGREAKASEMMIDLIDGLKWVVEAIELTASIQARTVDVTEINEHLAEIINAYENTDNVLLSDILEYELLPIVKEWQESL